MHGYAQTYIHLCVHKHMTDGNQEALDTLKRVPSLQQGHTYTHAYIHTWQMIMQEALNKETIAMARTRSNGDSDTEEQQRSQQKKLNMRRKKKRGVCVCVCAFIVEQPARQSS